MLRRHIALRPLDPAACRAAHLPMIHELGAKVPVGDIQVLTVDEFFKMFPHECFHVIQSHSGLWIVARRVSFSPVLCAGRFAAELILKLFLFVYPI